MSHQGKEEKVNGGLLKKKLELKHGSIWKIIASPLLWDESALVCGYENAIFDGQEWPSHYGNPYKDNGTYELWEITVDKPCGLFCTI